MDRLEELLAALTPEPLEVDLFRGVSPASSADRTRIFGGQVIAQALSAAYATVRERLCHSLHAYFIRPGDPAAPLLFRVERTRDGSSFATRRVMAIQHGEQILTLSASFQREEQGLAHQTSAPPAPAPGALPPFSPAPDWAIRPIELRPVPEAGAPEPRLQMWFRARRDVGDDPVRNQVLLAYASDMALMGASLRAHGLGFQSPDLQLASLDHALWFHRPSRIGDWHLYDIDSPSASGARGFNRGALFTEDGALIASVAQEALIRQR